MEKGTASISSELQRSVDAVTSRLSDPYVIVILLGTFLTAVFIPKAGNFHTTSLPVSLPPGEHSSSRFLVTPYEMPGPIAFDQLSPNAQKDFTLDGKIPVLTRMYSDKGLSHDWSGPTVARHMALADARNPEVGGELCKYGPYCNKAFFDALEAHPVTGMNVLVVGSIDPWLEAICLSFGANSTTTVDFTKPNVNDSRFRALSVPELDLIEDSFDAVFSYSSLEHDGLGRYGDPLNPTGDFQRMRKLVGLLKPGGKLYLGVPNGMDLLMFNAHRIYGPIRFPMLIQGWSLHGTYGDVLEDTYKGIFKTKPMCMPADREPGDMLGCFEQPVHVLTVA